MPAQEQTGVTILFHSGTEWIALSTQILFQNKQNYPQNRQLYLQLTNSIVTE